MRMRLCMCGYCQTNVNRARRQGARLGHDYSFQFKVAVTRASYRPTFPSLSFTVIPWPAAPSARRLLLRVSFSVCFKKLEEAVNRRGGKKTGRREVMTQHGNVRMGGGKQENKIITLYDKKKQ